MTTISLNLMGDHRLEAIDRAATSAGLSRAAWLRQWASLGVLAAEAGISATAYAQHLPDPHTREQIIRYGLEAVALAESTAAHPTYITT